MTDSDQSSALSFSKNAMTAFLQIGAVLLLLYWCLLIVSPFIGLVAWGLIIAVAIHPMHLRLAAAVGGSQKRAAILIVLIGLIVLVAPTWMMVDSSIDSARSLGSDLRDGTLVIPAPDPGVADWPVIGERVYAIWSGASQNLGETLLTFEVQLRSFGEGVLRNLGSGLLGVLQFVGSILIAGVFLVSGESGYRVSCAAARSIADERGEAMVDLTIATIRSVTKGVLGVAIVQTALAVAGLVVMDVPAAGIWGALILVIAVMQLPPWLILAPIAVWVFSISEPVPATIFAVYSLVVSISDMFLKPMFLGRGVDVPMPVILIGAIGGAIWAGVIGLFVGAVVLAIGYELFLAWIYGDQLSVETGEIEGEADETA